MVETVVCLLSLRSSSCIGEYVFLVFFIFNLASSHSLVLRDLPVSLSLCETLRSVVEAEPIRPENHRCLLR